MLAYHHVPNNSSLLQGDVIKWHAVKKQPFNEEYSLILNADCDLFSGKVRQYLTVVPIITLNQYVNFLWPSEEFDRIKNRIIKSIISDISGIAKRTTDKFSKISEELLEEITSSNNFEHYFRDFPFKNKKERENLKTKIECASQAKKMDSPFDPSKNSFLELSALEGKFSNLTHENALKRNLDKIKSRIVDPSQIDVFWISELPESPDIGYLIPLRYPRMIPLDTVRFERTNWYEDENSALRIGRLIDQIKFSIAEKFASQFHRVGLPTEYETLRKSIVSEMCDAFIKGKSFND